MNTQVQYPHAHTHSHTCTCTRMHMTLHAYIHMRTNAHKHAQACTQAHTYIWHQHFCDGNCVYYHTVRPIQLYRQAGCRLFKMLWTSSPPPAHTHTHTLFVSDQKRPPPPSTPLAEILDTPLYIFYECGSRYGFYAHVECL